MKESRGVYLVAVGQIATGPEGVWVVSSVLVDFAISAVGSVMSLFTIGASTIVGERWVRFLSATSSSGHDAMG